MLESDEVQLILKKKKKCKKLNSLNGSWWQGPQMCVHLSRIIIGILIFGSTWGSNGGVHCIGGPMAIPDICHGHKDGVRGEKIGHVEKFQLSVQDR